jgi:ADP-ribosylation factor GTPase-activating protein 2/3
VENHDENTQKSSEEDFFDSFLPGGSNSKPSSASSTTSASSTGLKARTTQSRLLTKSGPKKPKSGLGAIARKVNIDEAEQRAKEEAERAETVAAQKNDNENEDWSPRQSSERLSYSNRLAYNEDGPGGKGNKNKDEIDRLGMGVSRLGFGATANPSTPKKDEVGPNFGFGATSTRDSRRDLEGLCYVPICHLIVFGKHLGYRFHMSHIFMLGLLSR